MNICQKIWVVYEVCPRNICSGGSRRVCVCGGVFFGCFSTPTWTKHEKVFKLLFPIFLLLFETKVPLHILWVFLISSLGNWHLHTSIYSIILLPVWHLKRWGDLLWRSIYSITVCINKKDVCMGGDRVLFIFSPANKLLETFMLLKDW